MRFERSWGNISGARREGSAVAAAVARQGSSPGRVTAAAVAGVPLTGVRRVSVGYS